MADLHGEDLPQPDGPSMNLLVTTWGPDGPPVGLLWRRIAAGHAAYQYRRTIGYGRWNSLRHVLGRRYRQAAKATLSGREDQS